MSLFAPINLLWLLPLLGSLLALYFLRPRRVDKEVSSLFLWEAIALSSRQRLKLSLLLFLQILTLLFLILVLALPMSKLHSAPRTVTVIILDQSAGMKATDIAPNRYAVAKEAAEEYIKNNLHGADAAVIIGAGPGPMLICPQSSEIRACHCTHR
jgi:hypothetical protein